MSRVVIQFSCGATSAVAGKLALQIFAGRNIVIVNAFIKEEDDDNRRFLADVERWYAHPITILRDEKYGASVDEVWRRERYMVGQAGASCSRALKRKILAAAQLPGDTLVLGFDAGEQDRYEDFLENFPELTVAVPLIDRGLTKDDCLAMVERAGIQLPLMYRDGFGNANCPGCPKGGEGYWNRIRRVRPVRFHQVMAIQEELVRDDPKKGAYFFRNRKTGERFGLKDLKPGAGRHDEPAPSCGFFCSSAEREIEDGKGNLTPQDTRSKFPQS